MFQLWAAWWAAWERAVVDACAAGLRANREGLARADAQWRELQEGRA